ncbi:YidH family protein [Nodosilinea sp. AN01ver1]|uniref:YidH family protein n=1 Tax=Nodosilinea sp. AN01ver1 TaxID=3423362 RepID=UPI003D3235E6
MPSPPADVQAELARDRNRLAADRTLLSFARSSLTLIGLGVALDQILTAIGAGDRAIDAWVYGLSLVYVGVGVLSLVLAIADYQTERRRLRSPTYRYRPRWSIAEATGLAVLAIGAVALGWLSLDLIS